MFKYLFIPFLLAAGYCCIAQPYEEKNFTRYTKLDGLSNNYITGIVQDSTGYIWISTYKGLNRFDGKFFINLFKNTSQSPLPENFILSLRLQHKNEIIGSTRTGVFSFNTATRQYRHFIVPADSIIFFWANHALDALKDEKGNYVVSTKTGLYIFNATGKIICRYDQHNASDAGRVELWFGGRLNELSNGMIFQENGLLGSVYNPSLNRIDSFFTEKRKNLKQALLDKDGELRISFPGRKDELFIINSSEKTMGVYNILTHNYSLSSIPVSVIGDLNWDSRLFYIQDSLLAITSNVNGFYLFHYNASTKNISCDSKKYFASKYCTSIFNDRDGRLWVGTNDGLYKLNLRNSFFTAEDLSVQLPGMLNTGVQSIYIEKNKIFAGLGNEGGLLLLDKKTKKINQHIQFKNSEAGCNSINFILPYHPDTLWLGTANGLIWFNKNNFSNGRVNKPGQPEWMNKHQSQPPAETSTQVRLREPGEPDWMHQNKLRNFLEDSYGNIWLSFGKLNSVVFFNRSENTFKDISAPINPLLKITFCFSMAEDKEGNIWLAGDGLCRWNRKKKVIDTLIPYPAVSKQLYNYFQILDRDENNNLWLASYANEIIQYNCTDNHMYLRLPDNSMIDGNTVTNSSIIRNAIWMGMVNGISAFNIKDYSVEQFNYADGLPSAVVTSLRKGSFYDQTENRFYFGAGHYLISFIPDVTLSHMQIPQLFLETISKSDIVLSEKPGDIRLPYSQNDVQLRFNAINFTDPEENRFSYRMANEKDSSWHELYTQNSIALSNLIPGSHRIEVKLFPVNNRWPAQLKTISITITPPFWKTTWFYLVVALIIAVTIYYLYRRRIKQISQKANLDKLLAQTEMKALHSQMNPHFIFNCLNSIREMILNNENQQASHYLNKFAQIIRITLNQSSKPFVSLKDTIDYLQRYMEMEQIRTPHFNYTIETDESLQTHEIMLPPMLIQPFIENAIWHGASPQAKPMQLQIHFYQSQQQLICIIEDDGIGIETSLKNKESQLVHEPVGIANIMQRIQVLNEKYNLNSSVTIEDKSNISKSNGTGTIVTIKLPIKNTEI